MLITYILLPLAVAAILPLTEKASKRVPDFLALGVTALLFALQVGQIGNVSDGEKVVWSGVAYGLPEGFSLSMDGLSLLFLVTISLVAFFSGLFSIEYTERYGKKSSFYALFLLMVTGMSGMVLTNDLFNLYVFLEVAAVAGYALIAYGQEHEGVEAAFKYLMMSVVATTAILLSLSFIYFITGSLSFSGLAAQVQSGVDSKLIAICLALFLMGFSLKVGAVPFHAWLPDAYPSAPAPVSAMLSGILGKVSGLYALTRIVFNVFEFTPVIQQILLWLGILSAVVGALLALGQTDMCRMLAYSSISQVGYIFLGFSTGTPLGVLGGLFHLFNHSVFKSLLFLDAGSTEYATGIRDMKRLGGINNRLPITGLTTTIGLFSTAGIPPFNGFWSKLLIIVALVQSDMFGTAALAVIVSILTLWYFLLMQRYAFYGKMESAFAAVKEVPFYMACATFCLALLCLVTGLLFPWLLQSLIEPGVTALLGSTGNFM